MSARPIVSTPGVGYRPRLIYSAGFDLVSLTAIDRDALTEHCRSLEAMQTSIGSGSLGELYAVPRFGQADFTTDHVVAARIDRGPLIATAQVHRVSRLLAWGELWYTAWPGDWAHGACAQCIGRALHWARRHGLASLVVYSKTDGESERRMLTRAGFVVSSRQGELVGELELSD